MNSTVKHRILGLLVMIALIILLFPFFQGKHEKSIRELAIQNSVMNVPPFPTYNKSVKT